MTRARLPLRIFLDTGVIVEGCCSSWGAAKGVLILATYRRAITIVLADAVNHELQRNLAHTIPAIAPEVSGWLREGGSSV